jgi:uncharacterized integral membrane protein
VSIDENEPEAIADQGIAKNKQKATMGLDEWRITRPLVIATAAAVVSGAGLAPSPAIG